MLSAPVVAAARADMVIGVTPLVGAAFAGMVSRRGRPFGAIVTDLVGNAAVQSGTTSGHVAKVVAAAEYRVLRRADRVGVITTKFNPALISGGVDADRIIEVPLFSHVGRVDLTPAAARRALGWPEDGRLTVVHTGNMGMKQGLEHVLDAARLANDRHAAAIEFVFVGDGSTRAFLQRQAAGLDGVRFLDLVPDEDYPVVLAAADVLLIHERPGVSEMSLPSKLTSYTTASRPIVAAVGSNSMTESLLSSRNAALVVPNGDPAALVDGLLRVRNDHALRARLVDAARLLGQEQFSERNGRHHYVGFAKALAESRPHR
jgi:glycosyltransferase involved in cell wall biosynthesis